MKKIVLINFIGIFIVGIGLFLCLGIDKSYAKYYGTQKFVHYPYYTHSFYNYTLGYAGIQHRVFLHKLRKYKASASNKMTGSTFYGYCLGMGNYVPLTWEESYKYLYRLRSIEDKKTITNKDARRIRTILIKSYPHIAKSSVKKNFAAWCKKSSSCSYTKTMAKLADDESVIVIGAQKAIWRLTENGEPTAASWRATLSSSRKTAINKMYKYFLSLDETPENYNNQSITITKTSAVKTSDKKWKITYKLSGTDMKNFKISNFVVKSSTGVVDTAAKKVLSGNTLTVTTGNLTYNCLYSIIVSFKVTATQEGKTTTGPYFYYSKGKQAVVGYGPAQSIERTASKTDMNECAKFECPAAVSNTLQCTDKRKTQCDVSKSIQSTGSKVLGTYPDIDREDLEMLYKSTANNTTECKNKYCSGGSCCKIEVKFSDLKLNFAKNANGTITDGTITFTGSPFAKLEIVRTCYNGGNSCDSEATNNSAISKYVPSVGILYRSNINESYSEKVVTSSQKSTDITQSGNYCVYTTQYEYSKPDPIKPIDTGNAKCGDINVNVCSSAEGTKKCETIDDKLKTCPFIANNGVMCDNNEVNTCSSDECLVQKYNEENQCYEWVCEVCSVDATPTAKKTAEVNIAYRTVENTDIFPNQRKAYGTNWSTSRGVVEELVNVINERYTLVDSDNVYKTAEYTITLNSENMQSIRKYSDDLGGSARSIDGSLLNKMADEPETYGTIKGTSSSGN